MVYEEAIPIKHNPKQTQTHMLKINLSMDASTQGQWPLRGNLGNHLLNAGFLIHIAFAYIYMYINVQNTGYFI
jgi:hypothetical protein